MERLDLFKLHDNLIESGPCSWIVCDGKRLYNKFYNLVLELMKINNYKKLTLCKEISNRINCSQYLLYDILRKKTLYFHLRLIKELLLMIKEKDEVKYDKFLNDIVNSIETLKSNAKSKFIIKAHKICDENISKFCGVHAADGTLGLQINIENKYHSKINKIYNLIKDNLKELRLSKINRRKDLTFYFCFVVKEVLKNNVFRFLKFNNISYRLSYHISITDGHESDMLFLKNLIKNLFGINAKIKHKDNRYTIDLSNKIIGCYLNNIFCFPLGYKCKTVKAPDIIKNSDFKVKKAFCNGFMQFDGSVKFDGRVSLNVRSKFIIDFISKIMDQDNIKINCWVRKDGEFSFDGSFDRKFLEYFNKTTFKYNRLYWYAYGNKIKFNSLDEINERLKKVFPTNKNNSSINFVNILNLIIKLNEFDRYKIVKETSLHYKSVEKILRIFEVARIINVYRVNKIERVKGISDKIIFNKNFNEWSLPEITP